MSKRHFVFSESKKTRTSLERYGCQKDILCLVRVKKTKTSLEHYRRQKDILCLVRVKKQEHL